MSNPHAAKPAGKSAAVGAVDRHVSPKECFIWYASSKLGWTAMPGTGCAHYVAHKLGLKASGLKCLAGYVVRVPDLVAGMAKVKVEEVTENDIWTNAGLSHTGIVVEVKEADGVRNFVIEHCSSAQGGVVRNEWRTHFGGQGSFHRPKLTGKPVPTAQGTARTSGLPVSEVFS